MKGIIKVVYPILLALVGQASATATELWPDRVKDFPVPPNIDSSSGTYDYTPFPDGRVLVTSRQLERSIGRLFGADGQLLVERADLFGFGNQGKARMLPNINRLVIQNGGTIAVHDPDSLQRLDGYSVHGSWHYRILNDGTVCGLTDTSLKVWRLDGKLIGDYMTEIVPNSTDFRYYHVDDDTFAIHRRRSVGSGWLYLYEYRTGNLRWKRSMDQGELCRAIVPDGKGGVIILHTTFQRVSANGMPIWTLALPNISGSVYDHDLDYAFPFRVIGDHIYGVKSSTFFPELQIPVVLERRSLATGATLDTWSYTEPYCGEGNIHPNGTFYFASTPDRRQVTGINMVSGAKVFQKTFDEPVSTVAAHGATIPVIVTTTRGGKFHGINMATGALRYATPVHVPATFAQYAFLGATSNRVLLSLNQTRGHLLLDNQFNVIREVRHTMTMTTVGRNDGADAPRFLIDEASNTYLLLWRHLNKTQLTAFNLSDGAQRWVVDLLDGQVYSTRFRKGNIELVSQFGFSKRSLETGSVVGGFSFAPYSLNAGNFSNYDFVFGFDLAGRLVRFNENGSIAFVGGAHQDLQYGWLSRESSSGTINFFEAASYFGLRRVNRLTGTATTPAVLGSVSNMVFIDDQVVLSHWVSPNIVVRGYDANTMNVVWRYDTLARSSSGWVSISKVRNSELVAITADRPNHVFPQTEMRLMNSSGDTVAQVFGRHFSQYCYAFAVDNDAFLISHKSILGRYANRRLGLFIPCDDLTIQSASIVSGSPVFTDLRSFGEHDLVNFDVVEPIEPIVEVKFKSDVLQPGSLRVRGLIGINERHSQFEVQLLNPSTGTFETVVEQDRSESITEFTTGDLDWNRYVDATTGDVTARVLARRTGSQSAPIPLKLSIDELRLASVP